MYISKSTISTNQNTESNKKQDNADNPSGPYAAASSIVATMRNPPTKLIGNLS